MLFRTVYGPELEAIYGFVNASNANGQTPSREDVHCAFVPQHADGATGSTQNVDDALLFLRSAGLLDEDRGYAASSVGADEAFRLRLLRSLRRIEQGEKPYSHAVDPLYTLLLDELFIKPDNLFVQDVHTRANEAHRVKEVGGLSREKTQAWQRVMSFIGVGRRVAGGFQCVYAVDLVLDIVRAWPDAQGTLQSFCEEYLGAYLPFARRQDGDLAMALRAPLGYLMRHGDLELLPLQDSPSRPYFGERRLRGLRVRAGGDHGS